MGSYSSYQISEIRDVDKRLYLNHLKSIYQECWKDAKLIARAFCTKNVATYIIVSHKNEYHLFMIGYMFDFVFVTKSKNIDTVLKRCPSYLEIQLSFIANNTDTGRKLLLG